MSKVLIVGLDGATWTVLKPLIERGVMPYLAGLIENGSSGVLESVMPPVTAPAWVSFMTGKHPDKHGILDFRHFDPVTKRSYITNSSFIKGKTLWQIISDFGKKVAVINVPYTYPVYPVNGILVSGFDAPSKDAGCYYPASLQHEIESRFPAYSPVLSVWSMREVADKRKSIQYIRQLSASVQLRTQVALYLLVKYDWDVAMIHYQEIDFIQHVMWDRILQTIQATNKDEISDELLSFFKVLDNSIKELSSHALQIASGDMDLLVVSDHGFGEHIGVVYPNLILENMGWLTRTRGQGGEDVNKFKEIALKLSKKMASSRSMILCRIYYALKGLYFKLSNRTSETLVDELGKKNSWMSMIDWDKTRAAMVTGDMCAFIFVRDVVKDVSACLQELRTLTNPDTSEPVFRAVWTFEEAYGRHCEKPYHHFIIAIPQEGYSVSIGFSEAIVRSRTFAEDYPGIHHLEGILVASGPDIRRGVRTRASLVDMAPTILYLLDLPIPDDMDGRVALDMLTLEREPRVIPASDYMPPTGKQEYSEEEKALIEERLRALGYLQ
jgi:predicted AlkP superfamily phosphohydrolase/phosphomutase